MAASQVAHAVSRPDGLTEADRQSPEYKRKLLSIQNFKWRSLEDIFKRFPWPSELDEEDGTLSWNGLVIVPEPDVQGILEAEHAEVPASFGRIKFASLLKNKYIGVSSAAVGKFLAESDEHQIWNRRRASQITRATVASAPFKQLESDLTDIAIGPFRHLFVTVDRFSKFLWVTPLKTKSAAVLAREFQRVANSLPAGARVGSWKSDNGTEMKNAQVAAVLAKTGTVQVFGTAGNPLGQGTVESTNSFIKSALVSAGGNRAATLMPTLARVVDQYNHSVHSTTQMRPSDLNRTDLSPAILQAVREKLLGRAGKADRSAPWNSQLEPGQKVRVDVAALDSSIALQRKAGTYKPSHHPSFSDQVYTVLRHDAQNFVTLVERPSIKVLRGQVVAVPSDAKDLSEMPAPVSSPKTAREARQEAVAAQAALPPRVTRSRAAA